MALHKINAVLEALRAAYNSGDHSSYIDWFSNPVLVIEDSGHYSVSDPVILARLFESGTHCYEYLDLPTVEFYLYHFQRVSNKIVIATIIWEFLNSQKKSETSLEVVYILQEKDEEWKIISLSANVEIPHTTQRRY